MIALAAPVDHQMIARPLIGTRQEQNVPGNVRPITAVRSQVSEMSSDQKCRNCLVLMVPRDRIELPTRGFSVH